MQLIERLQIYARGTCPLVGIPLVEERRTVIVNRAQLRVALLAPTIEVVKITPNSIVLTGPRARYTLYDLLRDREIVRNGNDWPTLVPAIPFQVLKQGINKWAETQRRRNTVKATLSLAFTAARYWAKEHGYRGQPGKVLGELRWGVSCAANSYQQAKAAYRGRNAPKPDNREEFEGWEPQPLTNTERVQARRLQHVCGKALAQAVAGAGSGPRVFCGGTVCTDYPRLRKWVNEQTGCDFPSFSKLDSRQKKKALEGAKGILAGLIAVRFRDARFRRDQRQYETPAQSVMKAWHHLRESEEKLAEFEGILAGERLEDGAAMEVQNHD